MQTESEIVYLSVFSVDLLCFVSHPATLHSGFAQRASQALPSECVIQFHSISFNFIPSTVTPLSIPSVEYVWEWSSV